MYRKSEITPKQNYQKWNEHERVAAAGQKKNCYSDHALHKKKTKPTDITFITEMKEDNSNNNQIHRQIEEKESEMENEFTQRTQMREIKLKMN